MKPMSPLQRGTAAKRQGVAHTIGLTVFCHSFTPSMIAATVLTVPPTIYCDSYARLHRAAPAADATGRLDRGYTHLWIDSYGAGRSGGANAGRRRIGHASGEFAA